MKSCFQDMISPFQNYNWNHVFEHIIFQGCAYECMQQTLIFQ